ncbi:MAG: tetratricopeptide repeat protein [Alphaproteobacteria bacterium]|nr:tetratricopeptide repeat protein [Alphaproteobacteria bacterium]
MKFIGGGGVASNQPSEAERKERAERPRLVFFTWQPSQGGSRKAETLTVEQIEERLLDGRARGEDRVRKDGEAYQGLSEHPAFADYFRPGEAAFVRRVDALRAAEERERVRQELSQAPIEEAKTVSKPAIAAAAAAGLLLVIAGLVAALSGGGEEAVELPGAALVAALQERYPAPPQEAIDPTLLWMGLDESGRVSWERARATLELQVAARPDDVNVLAPLAVVYARMAEQEAGLRPQSIELMRRATALAPAPPVEGRLQAGMSLFGGGTPEVALKSATDCLSASPGDGVCLWYQGQALLNGGHFDEARTVLKAASEQLGGSAAVDVALLGMASMRALDLLAAESAFEAYLAQRPDDGQAELLLARLHRRVGRFDEAIRAARRAVELEPFDLEARYLLGALLLHVKGDAASALPLLEAVVEAKPERRALRDAALLQASIAARRRGDAERAVELADRGLAENARSPAFRLALAEAQADAGRPETIERLLRDADLVQLDEQAAVRFLRAAARLHDRLGWERQATFAREQAQLRFTGSLDTVLEEAWSQLDRDNGELAAGLVLGAWRLDPLAEMGHDPITELPIAPLSLSRLASRLEAVGARGSPERLDGERAGAGVRAMRCVRYGADCSGARSRLSQALRASPEDRALNAWLAQVLLRSGGPRPERPLVLATGGIGGGPLFSALLGEIMARNGATGSAVTALESAVRQGKDDPAVLRRVASAYARLGQADEALTQARRAAALAPDDWMLAQLILGVQHGEGRSAAAALSNLTGE